MSRISRGEDGGLTCLPAPTNFGQRLLDREPTTTAQGDSDPRLSIASVWYRSRWSWYGLRPTGFGAAAVTLSRTRAARIDTMHRWFQAHQPQETARELTESKRLEELPQPRRSLRAHQAASADVRETPSGKASVCQLGARCRGGRWAWVRFCPLAWSFAPCPMTASPVWSETGR